MSEQLPIDFARTHARTNDPSTSHEAAALVVVRAGTTKHKILNAMISDQSRPWTSEEIAERCSLNAVQIGKRTADLRDRLGWIEDTGEKRKLPSGRRGIVWGCTWVNKG